MDLPGRLCRTCLSPGRKMFPFPLNYTKLPFSTFYKDLRLTATDMICWECKSFILKMAAFRLKALKAQANLETFRREPWTTLQSLSKLAISKGIDLEIIEHSEPDPLTFDEIKTESYMELELAENYVLGEQYNEIGDENIEIGVKDESGDKNEEIGDENNKDVIFQVFQHEILVAPESDNQNVADDGNIANATLMSLLSKKSSLFSFPPPLKETSTQKKQNINIDVEKPQESTNIPEIPRNSQTVTNTFTEERLTEDEMRRWWESKRENEFFSKSIPVFRCEKCVEPFLTRRSFLGHKKLHTEMFGGLSCDVCEMRFSKEGALAAHKDNHYRLLKCGYCAHKWDNPNSMRRHCHTEHRVPIAEWNCDLCSRELPSHSHYLNHVKAHGAEPCRECGRRVNTTCMRTHMLTHDHSLGNKFECAECGAKRRTKALIKSHILRVHLTKGDRRAFCAECNKHFRNMNTYKAHMKYATKHVAADLLRYKCKECPRAFACRRNLRRHVEGKHSDQGQYQCELCSARFRSAHGRARHRRVHHDGYRAPRDHVCDHCGKYFTKSQLSSHINTHTGARPFVCKLCGADFGHKSALYLHGRYKHKIQKITQPGTVAGNSVQHSGNDNSDKDDKMDT